jgi:phospholipid-binding lipoprotein MlaA
MSQGFAIRTAFLLVVAALAGCATPPPASDPDAVAEFKANNDPAEPMNRRMYAVHDAIDTAVLVPVARTWRDDVPDPVRQHIGDFLENARGPTRFANDTLQAKPRRAGDTLMRFLLNSTLGLGGLFDVATDLGYPTHATDFGITLGMAGVGPGPYLFIPIMGPTGVRDATSIGADIAMSPLTWVGLPPVVKAVNYGRGVVAAVNTRSDLLDTVADVKHTALDPYATFRSLYQQHRQSEIEATRADDRATVPAWFRAP